MSIKQISGNVKRRRRIRLATIDGVPVPKHCAFADYTIQKAEQDARSTFARVAEPEGTTPDPPTPPRAA